MNIDLLVDEVTRIVKEKLVNTGGKKKLLLLDKGESQLGNEIREVLGDSLEVHGMEDCSSLEAVEKYDLVLANGLEVSELSGIATGLCGGMRQNIMIECILRGKKAYVMEDRLGHLKYATTCKGAFYQMLEDYAGRLEDYGISRIGYSELMKILRRDLLGIREDEAEVAATDMVEDIPLLDKRVVTEKDVSIMAIQGVGQVKILHGSIVTPLARDVIKNSNIEIICERD